MKKYVKMLKIKEILGTMALASLMSVPVSGFSLEWYEKNGDLCLLDVDIPVVGVEVTFSREILELEEELEEDSEEETEEKDFGDMNPEFSPLLSIHTSLLREEDENRFTIFVAGDKQLSEDENFVLGTLFAEGMEDFYVESVKMVDFLLNETLYERPDFELLFSQLDSEENTDAEKEDDGEEEEKVETEEDTEAEEQENEEEDTELKEESDVYYTEEEWNYRQEAIVNQYTDMKDHWAEKAMAFVVDQGYFLGVTESEFAPNSSMTRGMFVTVLGNVAGADKNKAYDFSFLDVSPEDWFYGYVGWATTSGIATGMGEGIFAPNTSITREQLAVMLVSFMNVFSVEWEPTKSASLFKDHYSISEWAREAVYYLQSRGLLEGREDNTFDPQGLATRAEVASIVYTFVNYEKVDSLIVG